MPGCRVKVAALGVLLSSVLLSPHPAVGLGNRPGANLQCGSWENVASPSPSSSYNFLNEVSALSPNDAWAVGRYTLPSFYEAPLIEHWNGTTWTVVDAPDFPNSFAGLSGVTAVAPNDVWAVGTVQPDGGHASTLVLHWDGTGWSRVDSPNVGPASNVLQAVTAVASNDIWAVGYYLHAPVNGLQRPLILHWDGISWALVETPGFSAQGAALWGVEAASSDDVWAVGRKFNEAFDSRPLVEHWDGAAWTLVRVDVGSASAALTGVEAIGGADVWAVGTRWSPAASSGLVAHWDGGSWSRVPSPLRALGLSDIAAISMGDIWADVSFTGRNATAYEHWDGAEWTWVPGEETPGRPTLVGMDALPTGYAWAVGNDYSSAGGGVYLGLIQAYCPA